MDVRLFVKWLLSLDTLHICVWGRSLSREGVWMQKDNSGPNKEELCSHTQCHLPAAATTQALPIRSQAQNQYSSKPGCFHALVVLLSLSPLPGLHTSTQEFCLCCVPLPTLSRRMRGEMKWCMQSARFVAGTIHFGALMTLRMLLFLCTNHSPVHALRTLTLYSDYVVYMSGYMRQSLPVLTSL